MFATFNILLIYTYMNKVFCAFVKGPMHHASQEFRGKLKGSWGGLIILMGFN